MFQEGMLDAALLSSIDVLSMPDAEVVDGVAIGSRGDVHSVVLAYTGELHDLRTIHLDPSSHTSNALLKIILSIFHQLDPKYVQIQEGCPRDLPMLLIGDPAISFRKRTSLRSVKYLDLGGEWYRRTGLPFIFALWALRKDFTEKSLISDILRGAKKQGISNLAQLASRTPDPDFAQVYLESMIRFELNAEEKSGLELFATLARECKIINDASSKITYR
jgi:predicted solute-binding protein